MNFLEKTKRQFDRWARMYDSFLFRIYFEPIYQKLIELIRKEEGALLAKGGKFLDVACGTGEILYRLAKKYTKSEFVGLDLSPKMITKAKQKSSRIKNLSFHVGNVEELLFKDDTFDFLLCSEAFHHFVKPKKSLREMHRVLKKGGLFLLMDPAYDTFFQRKIIGTLGSLIEIAKKNYSRAEFIELLESAGFTISHSFYWRFNNFFIARKT